MPQTRNRLKPVQTGRFHLGLVFSPWRRGAFGNLGPPPSRRSHWSRTMPPRKRPPRSLAGGPVDPLRASEGRRERAAAGGGVGGDDGGDPPPHQQRFARRGGGGPLPADRPSRAVTQRRTRLQFAKRARRCYRALVGWVARRDARA